MTRIQAEPISSEAFAPFGEILDNAGPDRRRYSALALDGEAPARPSLWISQGAPLSNLPLRITAMERHPWSAQSFVPLTPARYLVIVCAAVPDGAPDTATMRAFIVAGQGICYRRNVWHHGMTVLDPGAKFVTLMADYGHDDDDIFRDLSEPIEIFSR